ncbi:hypothetical protein A6V39_03215 [Candidatus Mycoplasma haematobovis]|uniref:DUF31 domain-containing protein n=1 Tax=Candidatus Mycoplasma haematobovis TaxID=432608 RepID=A0A1A9QFD6_9MOLU|nr:hypothetical protein [Candidatus Mycoplasma haematobovis]OAL10419.1 hypothetical protein A6V39_03215 [Candidatus Mycoplasma haematobovis]
MIRKRFLVSLISIFGLGSILTTLLFSNLGKDSELLQELTNVELVKEEDKFDLPKIKEEARKAFETMNDYSFRIFSACTIGTGWVLDYEIPKEGHYPTTWYIATNAHVVNEFRFVDNPYGQELPIPAEDTKVLRNKYKNMGFSNLKLNNKTTCDASKNYGYFDLNLSKPENGYQLKSNLGAIHNKKMKEPKLFYVPINFLEKDESVGIKENNYRDFAVIEIEFINEDYAREATRDFYSKYPVGSKDAINVFGAPLDKQKTWSQIENSIDNYYSLAYPQKKNDPFAYSINFDESSGEASKLTKDRHGISDGKIVHGHVNAVTLESKWPFVMTEWNGKKLNSVGHFYLLENFSMPGGSSGALYIDKNGSILGIKRLGEWEVTNHSWVVPLRSSEIVKDGVIQSPAYDLILGGAPRQKTSYKQQIERYGKKTFLSESGWKHSALSLR